MIDYKKLLSSTRLRKSNADPTRNILTESESDRGRVLFSPAFRRLQQKAQVFSMEPNAAVRSRLTHSLEVSQIGRYLADEIIQLLGTRLDAFYQGALVNFVEAACLMHDIGNPPFGHFGDLLMRDGRRLHLIMVDMSTSARAHLEKLRAFLGDNVFQRIAWYASGRSFHGYGESFLERDDWVKFMGLLLLANQPRLEPTVDPRWIGHRL